MPPLGVVPTVGVGVRGAVVAGTEVRGWPDDDTIGAPAAVVGTGATLGGTAGSTSTLTTGTVSPTTVVLVVEVSSASSASSASPTIVVTVDELGARVDTGTVTCGREPSSVSSTWALTIAAADPAASTPAIDSSVTVPVLMATTLRNGRRDVGAGTSKNRPRPPRSHPRPGEGDQNAPVRILLVEDDRSIAVSLIDGLVDAGHEVVHVTTGAAALQATESVTSPPDVVLLDLGLPDMDGRDVCRVVRGRSNVPIIMLTARSDEFDRVLGLELGSDDYVTKPFSFRELLARIRAVVRRTQPEPVANADGPSAASAASGVQRLGPLELDRRTRRVHVDGEEIHLTAKEFDLLAYLALDPGAVSTRTQILEQVWDAHWYGPTKTVDAHVAALRKKLGAHEWIAAVRGVGFRLEVPG